MTPGQMKFLKVVQEKEYFPAGTKVLVALSGGQDSMTLFQWLNESRDLLSIELGIAHVNHGLRVESEMEERALQNLAEKQKIPFFTDKFTGKFTEDEARKFRYHFFEKIMIENGYTILVTAHHKGDVVETVLMREIAGRALTSLQGIKDCQPFAQGKLIRPLLSFDKEELDATLFFEDVTNQGTDYLRNRIRNRIIPALTQENPKFSEGILNLSKEIQLAMKVISEQIEGLGILGEQIELTLFQKQSKALQHFILQAYFEQFPQVKIGRAQFEELLHIIRRPQQYHQFLNKEFKFIKTKTEFYLQKNAEKMLTELSVLTEDPKDESYMVVYLPKEGEVEIRKRQPGDRILINGHHKKLRKYFIEHQIPLEKRENPLIFVENQLYAIADVARSDLSKRAKNDKMRRTLWVKPSVREEKQHARKES